MQRITRQRQFSIQGGSHNQNARREPRAFNSLSALSRKSAAFARINLFNLLSPAFLSNPGRAGHHSNKTRAHRTKTDGCCWFLHRLLVPLRPSLCTTRIAIVFDASRLVTHPASLRYFSLRAHRRAGTSFTFGLKPACSKVCYSYAYLLPNGSFRFFLQASGFQHFPRLLFCASSSVRFSQHPRQEIYAVSVALFTLRHYIIRDGALAVPCTFLSVLRHCL